MMKTLGTLMTGYTTQLCTLTRLHTNTWSMALLVQSYQCFWTPCINNSYTGNFSHKGIWYYTELLLVERWYLVLLCIH